MRDNDPARDYYEEPCLEPDYQHIEWLEDQAEREELKALADVGE